MLYYLFDYLNNYNFPGAGLFGYISFRAALALVSSLIVSVVIGKRVIKALQKQQIGETVRDLGLSGQVEKSGTPTMGGIIILGSILIPTLLFAKLHNIYVITMIVATVWLGLIGFIDDYIKVFKKDKKGLKGIFKVVGQIGVGLIIGCMLTFSDDVKVHKKVSSSYELKKGESFVSHQHSSIEGGPYKWIETDQLTTTIPFVKNNEFNYNWLLGGDSNYVWMIFIPLVIFIVIAVSNGANMTDGLDGLATVPVMLVALSFSLICYLVGNSIFANYLQIQYIPNVGELSIFCGSIVGSCLGFLWYNAPPAKIFMGDTGSLSLGGSLAAVAIIAKHEIVLAIVGGLFVLETVSVIIQVISFKLTGKRIFKMAPIHHHFEQKGWAESTIVIRFWIIAIILALVGLATLKLR